MRSCLTAGLDRCKALRLRPKFKHGIKRSSGVLLMAVVKHWHAYFRPAKPASTGGILHRPHAHMHVCAGHSLLGVFYELLLRERPAPAYADYMQRTSRIGLAVATLYQAWPHGSSFLEKVQCGHL